MWGAGGDLERILRTTNIQVATGRPNAKLARAIHGMRTDAGLSQLALAELVGATASVMCRLEDSVYDSHSFPYSSGWRRRWTVRSWCDSFR